jgi:hypothetical protein
VAIGHRDACLDAVAADRARQLVQVHAGAWMCRNLDHLHAQRDRSLEHTEVGRALHGDRLAGAHDGTQRELDGFERAAGDRDVVGRQPAAEVGGTARNLPAQRLDTGRHVVTGAVERSPGEDPPHDQIEPAAREQLVADAAGAKGHVGWGRLPQP